MGIATSQGYNALNSQGWYLDHLSSTWESMYTNDPMQGVDGPAAQALVLGGQGEMWGETVDTSDIESTVWPFTPVKEPDEKTEVPSGAHRSGL